MKSHKQSLALKEKHSKGLQSVHTTTKLVYLVSSTIYIVFEHAQLHIVF